MQIYLIIFIFFFKITNSFAETKIAYIDINFILTNSIVGKSLNDHLKSFEGKHYKKFNAIEEKLLLKEKNLISKKNILELSEFNKNFNLLKEEVKNYRIERKKSNDQINKIKIENTKKILTFLNPIVTKYVEENSISVVLPKKNIIVGKKNLDITNIIVNILNDNVKSIEF